MLVDTLRASRHGVGLTKVYREPQPGCPNYQSKNVIQVHGKRYGIRIPVVSAAIAVPSASLRFCSLASRGQILRVRRGPGSPQWPGRGLPHQALPAGYYPLAGCDTRSFPSGGGTIGRTTRPDLRFEQEVRVTVKGRCQLGG